ncbi:MAG TPA: asparagine synthase (glutamine-hydrolyzing) [Polyangiaceae bacterium]|nr:asparagine synthase (glutamine-hydrolyzing) [Polyangiaceae bacterium]
MCGIFGAIGATRRVDAEAALRVMTHRGPDQRAVLRLPGADGRPAAELGFVRLAILDLTENGAQPMRKDGLVIVFNGEIYDHTELRAELEASGVAFRSRSDTEVLLEGFRAFGEAVVDRITGMFAFAVWDERTGRLFAARDPAGKKPFFFAARPDGFFFASEIKGIVACGLRTTVDEAELPIFMALGHGHGDRTAHAEVRELRPGHTLRLEPGAREPVVRRYYRAPFGERPLELGVDEAVAKVRSLVDAAVKRRLVADVPIGAFLSGGIDSTVIVGLMAKHTPGRVKTFSIGFQGDPAYDETRFARMAAQQFGTEHTEFIVEPKAVELIEPLVNVHDGPFGDSSALPTSIVSRLTREHVTVALTGDGGDELFCGYTRFLAAEISERIPQFLRSGAASVAKLVSPGEKERSLRAKARRFFVTAERPLEDRLFAYSPYFLDRLDDLFSRDVAERAHATVRGFARESLDACPNATALSRVLAFNYETYLPYDLLVKADRSSMLHSLELRSPFLDRELTQFAARLPDAYRRRGLNKKWLLKRAFPELLPDALANRPKMGFGVPLADWFRGALRELLNDQLGPSARLYRYLRRDAVMKVLAEQDAGTSHHAHRVWLLLTLEVWLKSMESPA